MKYHVSSTTDVVEQQLSLGPRDTKKLAWICCLLLGVGILFPWNAFITSVDYFTAIYPSFPFAFVVSVCYNYPNFFVLFWNAKVGHRYTVTCRMLFGFLADFIALACIPFINQQTLLPRTVNLGITLAFASVTGLATAIVFGTTMSVAAQLPPQYTTAVMSGQGISGVLAGGIRILILVTLPSVSSTDPNYYYYKFLSALIYFGLAAFITVLAILSYFILIRLPFTRFYMSFLKKDADERGDLLNNPTATSVNDYYVPLEKVSRLVVFKKIWIDALNVFWVFFVTLSLFPGLTYEIKVNTFKNVLSQDLFVVILVATFQLIDFVGRTLPQCVIFIGKQWLWIPNLFRAVFFVLFILSVKEILLTSDWYPLVTMVAFAFTNGYFGTLAMIYGPTRVDDFEKEVAGALMSFFLQGGIFVGVHFALLLGYLVVGKTPF
jgi:equilibrative nucleoside transporter 1/2/3